MAILNMAPTALDLKHVRAGDHNTIRFTLTSGGAPWDLTGSTVTAQARKTAVDPDPPALTADIVMVDETGGVFDLSWDGDDITTLLAGQPIWSGVWDLQVESGTALPLTVLAGLFTAESDVTR